MGFFNRIWTPPMGGETVDSLRARFVDDRQPIRATVALGGGGARGAAHLGVMRRIAETDLAVERLVGVSMGALVGAMCAVDSQIESVQHRAIALLRSPHFASQQRLLGCADHRSHHDASTGIFSWYQRLKRYLTAHHQCSRVITGRSMVGNDLLREAIDRLIPDIDISETTVPLSIVAADLLSGQKIVLESGRLRTAVEASMAIPGIFQPVEYRGMLLCDIGTLDSLPIDIAKSYPHDLAIGVDVSQAPSVIRNCSTALDVMIRMEEIGEKMLRRKSLREADLIIRPHVHGIAWFDFHRVEALIDAGYQAAKESLQSSPAIKGSTR